MSSSSNVPSLAERLSDGKLLHIRLRDGVCVIRFLEPMLRDTDRHQQVKKVLERLSREYHVFIVDMSVVRYCSSLVLGALVLLRNTAEESGGCVHVCGVSGHVKELFAVTGMESLFDCFDDEDQALADLTSAL